MEKQVSNLVFVKQDGTACKLGKDFNNSEWFGTLKVQGFITKIAKGSEVEYGFEEVGGRKNLTFIKSTTGGTAVSASTTESSTQTPKHACSKCGAAMKDDKYDICYTCNQKAAKEEVTEPKSRQNSIEKQAMMKTSAEVVSRLFSGQGSIEDMPKIWEEIKKGYDILMVKFNNS